MSITRANYRSADAEREYMSVHQFLEWERCPARTAARLAGRVAEDADDRTYYRDGILHVKWTEACGVGTYVDLRLLTPDEFPAWEDANRATIYKGKKLDEKRAAFEHADEMIARVKSDSLAVALLTGATQVVLTGEISGVAWKGMADVYFGEPNPGRVVDLKTTADFDDGWTTETIEGVARNVKVPWYGVYRYAFQLAVYQELCRQVYGTRPVPFILAASKQAPPGLAAIVFDNQERLDAELQIGLSGLGQVLAYKRGDATPTACGKHSCDWCRATGSMRVESAI